MKKFSYLLVKILIRLFKYIPFSILYVLADLLYFILLHVIRYRLKIVENNLKTSFPGITPIDLKDLIRKFYRNLSDILVEGIKGLTLDPVQLIKRYQFNQSEIINSYLQQNQSVLVVNGHIGNWEWAVLQFGYFFKNRSIGIYKQINNEYLNTYINLLRGKSSIQLLSTRETRLIAEEIPKGKIIVLMGDQNPSNIKDAIWVNFLNRDTACLHGIEKYAKQYNLPVIFGSIKRIKRGYYTMNFSLLATQSEYLTPGLLTQIYMNAVEQNIREAPDNWLWTHRRWKHRRITNYE